MKWKEIIIGAVSSLMVTLLAGVGVYYWTKEPDAKKMEILEYSVDKVAAFKGGTNNIGVSTIRIFNRGGLPAQKVNLIVEYDNALVTDFSFESASGLKPTKKNIEKNVAEFSFESLVPADTITIGLLINTPDSPKISLRSSGSIGKSVDKDLPEIDAKGRVNRITSYLVPFSAVVAIGALGFVHISNKRRRQRTRNLEGSKNDVGFMLLHQGDLARGESILRESVESGEALLYSMSNLAYSSALSGDFDEADRLIRAARFYGFDKENLPIVTFNEAMIALKKGNKDEFFNKLDVAAKLDFNEIKSYCEYSIHLNDVRSDARFIEIIRIP